MDSQGRKLHAEAAKAREQGKFFESLHSNDQALVEYDKEHDSLGFAEGIACRSITLRVYANQKNSRKLLILAKHEMMASVEIARESHNPQALAMPLYNLAQLQEDLGELAEAVNTYKEALEIMTTTPPELHNRPSVLANMKIHMTTCEYKAGDTSALERAKAAVQELEKAEEPNQYNKDVWVSGAYMRLADALKTHNVNQAHEYLQKAKQIIDSNPDLLLRKEQWEKLKSSF